MDLSQTTLQYRPRSCRSHPQSRVPQSRDHPGHHSWRAATRPCAHPSPQRRSSPKLGAPRLSRSITRATGHIVGVEGLNPNFGLKIATKIAGKTCALFGAEFPCYGREFSLLWRKTFPVIFLGGGRGIPSKPLQHRRHLRRVYSHLDEVFPCIFPSERILSHCRLPTGFNVRTSPLSPLPVLEVLTRFPDIGVSPVSGDRVHSRNRGAMHGLHTLRLQVAWERFRMVQLGGLEPPTSGSTIRRSNQLSYNCTR